MKTTERTWSVASKPMNHDARITANDAIGLRLQRAGYFFVPHQR